MKLDRKTRQAMVDAAAQARLAAEYFDLAVTYAEDGAPLTADVRVAQALIELQRAEQTARRSLFESRRFWSAGSLLSFARARDEKAMMNVLEQKRAVAS